MEIHVQVYEREREKGSFIKAVLSKQFTMIKRNILIVCILIPILFTMICLSTNFQYYYLCKMYNVQTYIHVHVYHNNSINETIYNVHVHVLTKPKY